MQEKTPSGGLKWVRQDLLANLDGVRRDVAATGDLANAVASLFEVRGILLALPLPAAATLAEELQRTAEALASAASDEAPPMREVLLAALELMPDYLARVEAGAGEDPLSLLPAINELRTARGLPPMSAAELLLPASVLAQAEELTSDTLERLARIARKVRPHFHRYLVRWFGDADPDAGLIGLSRLFNQMRRYFKDGPVHELFLAAEGVVEGLLTGTIVPDPPCKALIGRIDKVLKPLAGEPPPVWPEEVASVLLSDLLAQLAQMPPGSPVLQELERAYGRRLNADAEGTQGEADTALLVDTLRQELAPIVAQLGPDVLPTAASLAAVAVRMQRLGESLVLIGQDALAGQLARCADATTMLAGAPTVARSRLDGILRTLAQVDTELQALGELAQEPVAESAPLSPRARDLTATTLREARRKLAMVRALFGQEPTTAPDPERLAGAAAALGVLAESLGGVGELEPARLLLALVEQLHSRYIGPAQVPGEAGLELIGRALAAVDIHLEDRVERDRVDPRMLGEATFAVERLTALLPAQAPEEHDSETMESQPASEVSHSVNLEFLALFRDEAEEELESIRGQFDRWRAHPEDDAALTSLYRSFQTLKGSGGLVGAQYLANLARLVAQLLDRLLERTRPADQPVMAFLDAVLTALPAVIATEAERRRTDQAELMEQGRLLLEADAGSQAPPQHDPPAPASGLLTEPVELHPSMPVPLTEDLTVEPLTALSASEDFHFARRDRQSALQAPPAEGLLVETMDLDTSVRAGYAEPADSGLLLSGTVVDNGDEVAFLDDTDLAQVFVDEARELLALLDDWLRVPAQAFNEAGLQAARRHLHTLKGSARMAGLGPIGDLGHALESLLGRPDLAPTQVGLVQRVLDLLVEQVEAVGAERPMPVAAALIAELEAGAAGGALAAAPLLGTPPAGPVGEPFASGGTLPLRLSPDWLDGMITLAGEAGTYRARLLQQNTRLGLLRAQLADSLQRLDRRLGRVRSDVPADERGELYLGQARELVLEAERLLDAIGDVQRDNLDLLQAQARITANTQDRLLETRMVPFSRVEPRLQRVVRQAAAGLDKQITLSVEGGTVEVDRTVLERFLGPLEHLLRNAVAHGIEPASVRAARGKPTSGSVRVTLEREGNDILFQIADDGAGMDPARIRAHAESRGLIAPGAPLDDPAVLALTLQPGFSTADTVTQLAGRGVGLDAVNTEIRALNGELTLTSRPGHGVAFSVRLPLTLSLVDALLVNAGGSLFALPHASLLAVARVERARLVEAQADQPISVGYRDNLYRVVSLAAVLHSGHPGGGSGRRPPPLPRRRWLPVVLVHAAGQRVAFQIDGLAGSQRVMVKPIGPPLGALRWLLGGTLLADGRVALLLDLLALIRVGALADAPPLPGPTRPRRLLAVGESPLLRRCARGLLGRDDLKVMTATDGDEMHLLLRRELPDLLLLEAGVDAGDGLALAERVRRDARLRQVPIIMLAALDDDSVRDHALGLGVDRLLVAPFDDAALGAEIAAVLPPGATP